MAFNLWGIAETGNSTLGVFTLTRDADNAWWNTNSNAWESYTAGNVSFYGIAAVETGTGTGVYTATNPDPTTAARALLLKKAGANLIQSDLANGLRYEEPVGYLLTNPQLWGNNATVLSSDTNGLPNVNSKDLGGVLSAGKPGFAGIDWAQVANSLAGLNLSNTTFGAIDDSGINVGTLTTATYNRIQLNLATTSQLGSVSVGNGGLDSPALTNATVSRLTQNLATTSQLGSVSLGNGGFDSPALTNAAVSRLTQTLATTVQLGSVSIGNGGLDSPGLTSAAVTRITQGLATTGQLGSVSLGNGGLDAPTLTTPAVNKIQLNLATTAQLGSVSISNGGLDSPAFTVNAINRVAGSIIKNVAYPIVTNLLGYVSIQSGVQTDTALPGFEFLMTDSSNNPLTGLTVMAARSIDKGAFSPCTNSGTISEVGSGIYALDLSASDLNGGVITVKFTAAGAATRYVTIRTTP